MDFRAFAQQFVIENGLDPAPVVLEDAWEVTPAQEAQTHAVEAEVTPEVAEPEVSAEAVVTEPEAEPEAEPEVVEAAAPEAEPEVTEAEVTEAAAEPEATEPDADTHAAEPEVTKQAGNGLIVISDTDGTVVQSAEVTDAVLINDDVLDQRYNPNQQRDPDGKWGDGIPGPQSGSGSRDERARRTANRVVNRWSELHSKSNRSAEEQAEFDKLNARVRDRVTKGFKRKGRGQITDEQAKAAADAVLNLPPIPDSGDPQFSRKQEQGARLMQGIQQLYAEGLKDRSGGDPRATAESMVKDMEALLSANRRTTRPSYESQREHDELRNEMIDIAARGFFDKWLKARPSDPEDDNDAEYLAAGNDEAFGEAYMLINPFAFGNNPGDRDKIVDAIAEGLAVRQ